VQLLKPSRSKTHRHNRPSLRNAVLKVQLRIAVHAILECSRVDRLHVRVKCVLHESGGHGRAGIELFGQVTVAEQRRIDRARHDGDALKHYRIV